MFKPYKVRILLKVYTLQVVYFVHLFAYSMTNIKRLIYCTPKMSDNACSLHCYDTAAAPGTLQLLQIFFDTVIFRGSKKGWPLTTLTSSCWCSGFGEPSKTMSTATSPAAGGVSSPCGSVCRRSASRHRREHTADVLQA